MPTLVHLADEREAASIKKNGIKIGKHRSGIYCMPVMQNFVVSHQWLRELKRRGARTYVGVYFKIDSNTKVFAGKYNSEHQHIELGKAIKEIQSLEDPLGYELIIDRKILSSEIEKIKVLPQNIGWRYNPGSNKKRPCSCRFCIKGTMKAQSVREKYEDKEEKLSYSDVLKKLQGEEDIDAISNLLHLVRKKKRRVDPSGLLFLLDKNSDEIDQELALTLAVFKHKSTRAILINLLAKQDDTTRHYAAYSLLELYGNEVEKFLESFHDNSIQRALEEWRQE